MNRGNALIVIMLAVVTGGCVPEKRISWSPDGRWAAVRGETGLYMCDETGAARVWYEERDPDAATAFLRELENALAEICENPSAWPPFQAGTRRFIMRRFPFQVIYRDTGETIQVIAVAHGRRRPGYWKSR